MLVVHIKLGENIFLYFISFTLIKKQDLFKTENKKFDLQKNEVVSEKPCTVKDVKSCPLNLLIVKSFYFFPTLLA